MANRGRPPKIKRNWEAIDGKLDRMVTIRTNDYYDRLLLALQARMKVSQGEIFRQGLHLLAIKWNVDPYENKKK